MAPMKRVAKSQAGGPAKRPSANPARAHCAAVSAALDRAPDAVLPPGARALLSSLVDGACSTFAADRHAYQVRVIGMIEQALQGVDGDLQRQIQDAKAKVDGVGGDRAAREGALEAAKRKLADSEAAIAAKKEALTAATADRADKAQALKATRKAQADVDAPFEGTIKDIAAAKECIEVLAVLQATSSDAAAGKKALKTILGTGKRYKLDSSLLESLTHVSKKAPAARAGFDLVVFSNISDAVMKLLDGFETALAAGDAPRGEAAAATAATAAALEGADAALCAAKEAVHAAEQEAKSCAAGVKAAQKTLSQWLPDTKLLMDAYDGLIQDLESFRTGVLASFAALKELAPEAEPVEEPEEVAGGGDGEAAASDTVAAE